LEAFLVPTGVVALGEMGDKTQLLAIVLAAMFRRPWPIVAGIFVATLANHAAAGAVGGWVAQALGPDVLRWVIGMMLANVPAVFLGDKFAKKVSMKLVHSIAAVIFAILEVLTLFNVGKLF
jgi:Ca2+/H+ antiporter, TMEM165/GDT1 family